MTGRERIEAYLRENRIPFVVHHHPVADAAPRAAAREHILGRVVAGVVVAIAGGRMALFGAPSIPPSEPVRRRTLAGADFGVLPLHSSSLNKVLEVVLCCAQPNNAITSGSEK